MTLLERWFEPLQDGQLGGSALLEGFATAIDADDYMCLHLVVPAGDVDPMELAAVIGEHLPAGIAVPYGLTGAD